MLKPCRSHEKFRQFLKEQLNAHYFKKGLEGTVLLCHHELAKVWITDLTPVYYILQTTYSKHGSPACDPVNMFRSMLLMEIKHINSFDEWVKEMRAYPLWAIYSGFSPDDVPGVGTFYDFQNPFPCHQGSRRCPGIW